MEDSFPDFLGSMQAALNFIDSIGRLESVDFLSEKEKNDILYTPIDLPETCTDNSRFNCLLKRGLLPEAFISLRHLDGIFHDLIMYSIDSSLINLRRMIYSIWDAAFTRKLSYSFIVVGLSEVDERLNALKK